MRAGAFPPFRSDARLCRTFLLFWLSPAVIASSCPACSETSLSSASHCRFSNWDALKTTIEGLPSSCSVGFTVTSDARLLASARIIIPKNVAIRLVGEGNGVRIDGQQTSRLFKVKKGAGLTLENVAITGAKSTTDEAAVVETEQGASSRPSGRVELVDCSISNTEVSIQSGRGRGGLFNVQRGVASASLTRVNITDVRVVATDGGSYGGGVVSMRGEHLSLTDVHIRDVSVSVVNPSCTNGCRGLEGAVLAAHGGTLSIANGFGSKVAMLRTSITNVDVRATGKLEVKGGVLAIERGTLLELTDFDIHNVNVLVRQGGGSRKLQGGVISSTQTSHTASVRMRISNVTVRMDGASLKGGVLNLDRESELNITDSSIERATTVLSGSMGYIYGAAMAMQRSRVRIVSTRIEDCVARAEGDRRAYGGAISVHSNSNFLQLVNSKVANCRAETMSGIARGGAIDQQNDEVSLFGTILENNSAVSLGTAGRGEGGHYSLLDGVLLLSEGTALVGGFASTQGGRMSVQGGIASYGLPVPVGYWAPALDCLVYRKACPRDDEGKVRAEAEGNEYETCLVCSALQHASTDGVADRFTQHTADGRELRVDLKTLRFAYRQQRRRLWLSMQECAGLAAVRLGPGAAARWQSRAHAAANGIRRRLSLPLCARPGRIRKL